MMFFFFRNNVFDMYNQSSINILTILNQFKSYRFPMYFENLAHFLILRWRLKILELYFIIWTNFDNNKSYMSVSAYFPYQS